MRHVGLVALAVLGCCPGALAADLPAAAPVPATAPVVAPLPQESGRFTLIEENDALMPRPTDRWYTQGLELNYLSAPLAGTEEERMTIFRRVRDELRAYLRDFSSGVA